MAELYREFVLRGRADWREAAATIKAAAPGMAARGAPLRLILADEAQDRLEEQVRAYFKAVIEPIADQVVVDGQRFSARAWHKWMKRRFLPPVEMRMPDGTVAEIEPSIARGEITLARMAEFTREVEAFAAAEMGVIFD